MLLPYILLNTIFSSPLPYYLGNTPWFIEYISFLCNFTFFHHIHHISLLLVPFLLSASFFFQNHSFLPLNINPCHLPYITELLTFLATCHIMLPLTMIHKIPIFFACKYIFHITDFCCTLNLCCQNWNSKFGNTHYLYNLFIFFYFVWYLATYLPILDTHLISLYILHLLPLQ